VKSVLVKRRGHRVTSQPERQTTFLEVPFALTRIIFNSNVFSVLYFARINPVKSVLVKRRGHRVTSQHGD
jgi:hypothetical protein